MTGISPTSGPAAGGTLVTITGVGFYCTDSVDIGGHSASFTVVDDNTITATTPAGTAGTTVDVVVTIAGTPHTLSGAFTYTAATTSNTQNLTTLQSNIGQQVATTSGQSISGAVDNGIGAGFSDGGTTTFGSGGGFINFAPDPRAQRLNRAEEAFSALGYAGVTKAPPPTVRDWSAWADIRGTGWKANDTSGNGNDLKGNQINLTTGIGYRLSVDTLVGVLAGYEHFKYDVASLAGSVKGDGESIGTYFSRRFGSQLQFDAALAWSHLNYNATSGGTTGSFTGSRWLVSTGLTGNQKVGAFVVEPSAKIYALWERQGAWTDSAGGAQAARNFSAGRTALGGRVAYPFEALSNWTVSPYAGLYGDWRFATDNALPTGTPVASIKDGWSGRVTAGMSATAVHGAVISVGGELGGLGADYKIWSGNVRGTVPF